MTIFFYALAGLISGVIAGMGMGGGTLLIPILTIFLKVEQHLAQGINLIVFVPMSFASLIIHCKNKLVDFKVGLPIILSGIFSSVGGSLLATKLNSILLKKLFGAFLLIVGIWQIITIFLPQSKEQNKSQFKVVGIFKYR